MARATVAREPKRLQRIEVPEAFQELFLPARYKVYWGGRGAAKSWSFCDALIARMVSKPTRVLCAREVQESLKESVLELLLQRIQTHNLGAMFRETKGTIQGLNGSEVLFEGLWRNIQNLKSLEGIDIAWVEEASAVSEDSWRTFIPTIRAPGSEIWASMNVERKSDPAYQRFIVNKPPRSIVRKVSWRDNPHLTDELREEMRTLKLLDYDEYLHVWEGELRRIATNAVYGKQLRAATAEGRICRVPIMPDLPVTTGWDLGRNDLMAIWFMQRSGMETRIIDYYENRLEDMPHYAGVLKEKGYNYDLHILPHDGGHTVLGSNNRTRKRILEDLGIKPIQVNPRIPILGEGHEITKTFMAGCWFDEVRCEKGLEALGAYSFKWSETEGELTNVVGPKWATNAADGLRTLAEGYNPARGKSRKLQFKSEWGRRGHV